MSLLKKIGKSKSARSLIAGLGFIMTAQSPSPNPVSIFDKPIPKLDKNTLDMYIQALTSSGTYVEDHSPPFYTWDFNCGHGEFIAEYYPSVGKNNADSSGKPLFLLMDASDGVKFRAYSDGGSDGELDGIPERYLEFDSDAETFEEFMMAISNGTYNLELDTEPLSVISRQNRIKEYQDHIIHIVDNHLEKRILVLDSSREDYKKTMNFIEEQNSKYVKPVLSEFTQKEFKDLAKNGDFSTEEKGEIVGVSYDKKNERIMTTLLVGRNTFSFVERFPIEGIADSVKGVSYDEGQRKYVETIKKIVPTPLLEDYLMDSLKTLVMKYGEKYEAQVQMGPRNDKSMPLVMSKLESWALMLGVEAEGLGDMLSIQLVKSPKMFNCDFWTIGFFNSSEGAKAKLTRTYTENNVTSSVG
jgi:hypothetical protein